MIPTITHQCIPPGTNHPIVSHRRVNPDMNPPLSHCPECGLRTARQTVQGELSSLFECSACGYAHERDNIAPQPIETQARLLMGCDGG